ncbi:MAG: Maf family protein, partial [Turicibacter sp.]
SPRRKELLELAGIAHRVVVSAVEEIIDPSLDVETQVQDLAIQKACAVAELHSDATVIGSDTIVVLDGKILGKPVDKQDAFDMLKSLSGRKHQVMTGVALVNKDKELLTSFVNITDVEFYHVTDAWIEQYIESDEPMDKAGSYGIQGKGFELVRSISGDYYSVMGLPIAQLKRTLSHLKLI